MVMVILRVYGQDIWADVTARVTCQKPWKRRPVERYSLNKTY